MVTSSATRHTLALLALLSGVVACAHAGAQAVEPDLDYLLAEPLPRIALIVGASHYARLTPLASASTDLQRMSDAIAALDFDEVLEVSDPCRDTLVEAMRLVSERVRELAPDGGATLFAFFAGHGAMIDHKQYLVPVDFAPDSADGAGFDEANSRASVAMDVLQRKLDGQRVGLGLFVVDACRTRFGQVPHAEGGTTTATCEHPGTLVWRKQLVNPVRPLKIGITVPEQLQRFGWAYANRPGAESFGASDAHQSSRYVAALVNRLQGDPLVPRLFGLVREDVEIDQPAHLPDLDPQSIMDTIAHDTPLRRIDPDDPAVRGLWVDTLRLASPQTVRQYVRSNPTSPYLRAALRWLRDRADATPATAAASAQAVLVPVQVAADASIEAPPTFRAVIGDDVMIRAHPSIAARETRLGGGYRREVLMQPDATGTYLQVVEPAATPAKLGYVVAARITLDAAELPGFWTGDDAVEVTPCLDGRADAGDCVLSRITPRAGARVLAVEENVDAGGNPRRESSSQRAYRRALVTLRALADAGVAPEQLRMQVVPESFAPSLAGRVLVKVPLRGTHP